MMDVDEMTEAQLKERIAELERENHELRRGKELSELHPRLHKETSTRRKHLDFVLEWDCSHELTQQQVERYSRQLIFPSFGVEAQNALQKGRVLVIGAGGLGSTALLYLAAAGVGHLGITDRDEVEFSNLHRQIIHKERSVGQQKVESAKRACLEINSSIQVMTYAHGLYPQNAVDMISAFDVIVDASDNVPTRYLANDVCVILKKPLVSGAAIGTDGQLTVYGYGKEGPCYRCLFPKAPPLEACSRCSEAGVIGPAPGTIGALQAMEAIKIVTQVGSVLHKKLMIFDFLTMDFRQVRLRNRREDCVCCGYHPTITASNLASYDYFAFTGQSFCEFTTDELAEKAPAPTRLTPEEFLAEYSSSKEKAQIIDIRSAAEFRICHLKGSMNFPFDKVDQNFSEILKICQRKDTVLDQNSEKPIPVCVVCKRGNDSQIILNRLHQSNNLQVKDLIGGLESWHKKIDPSFLMY